MKCNCIVNFTDPIDALDHLYEEHGIIEARLTDSGWKLEEIADGDKG